jgi:hypothetical protein
MAAHPRMMEQGGKAGGEEGRENKNENRRNVRVVRSSTSRFVDITETLRPSTNTTSGSGKGAQSETTGCGKEMCV